MVLFQFQHVSTSAAWSFQQALHGVHDLIPSSLLSSWQDLGSVTMNLGSIKLFTPERCSMKAVRRFVWVNYNASDGFRLDGLAGFDLSSRCCMQHLAGWKWHWKTPCSWWPPSGTTANAMYMSWVIMVNDCEWDRGMAGRYWCWSSLQVLSIMVGVMADHDSGLAEHHWVCDLCTSDLLLFIGEACGKACFLSFAPGGVQRDQPIAHWHQAESQWNWRCFDGASSPLGGIRGWQEVTETPCQML